jgi:hypothetical protein
MKVLVLKLLEENIRETGGSNLESRTKIRRHYKQNPLILIKR